ncbi:MAG: TIGR02186 family protein [Emcibacter sp.]|nr:TIGR02186 family protein [Emcibacter sp.]
MSQIIYHITGLLLGFFCSLLFVQRGFAENMVTDLSDHTIEITSRFSGTELLIFGAIERGIPQDDGGHGVVVEGMDYDIIVVVQSERHDMIIRRKEPLGPIWVNKENKILKNMPGFYALTSTRPIDLILSDKKLNKMDIGLQQLKIEFDYSISEEEKENFRDGFIRNMKARKLYNQHEGMVSILDGILFRAILEFPANMPVGNYDVDVYLIRNGKIILTAQSPLEVDKAGLERLIYVFAHNYSKLYGILAIVIALFAGWLAGFLSKKVNG